MTLIQHLGTEHGFPFSFAGAEKIVAIMIGNLKGMEILRRIQSGMKVTMVIEVGRKRSLSMNIFTILFISVSFFVVAAATLGCYVSYSARRLITARARSREQVSLCHCCFMLPSPHSVELEVCILWLTMKMTEFVCLFFKMLRDTSLHSLKLA